MVLIAEKLGQSCGAEITGIDLKKDLTENQIFEIRKHWLENHLDLLPLIILFLQLVEEEKNL